MEEMQQVMNHKEGLDKEGTALDGILWEEVDLKGRLSVLAPLDGLVRELMAIPKGEIVPKMTTED